MAFTLMAKAIQADIQDCHAKWLMVILADHANEYTHECWPSLDRLATRACMNKSTVTRKLNWLEVNLKRSVIRFQITGILMKIYATQ